MKKILAIALTLILILSTTQNYIALAEEFPEGKTFKELFPDEKFRQAIIYLIFPKADVSKVSKEVVIKDDLEKITELYVTDTRTKSVEGIEYLTNLEKLGIWEADAVQFFIENTPRLDKLTSLSLERADTSNLTINLSNYPLLTELGLGYLGLDEIPENIFTLKELKSLWLDGNNISAINDDIVKLENLESISLRKNPIKELPRAIIHVKKLTYIDLIDSDFENIEQFLLDAGFKEVKGSPSIVLGREIN